MRFGFDTWELAVSRRLRFLRLDGIRNKILAFALIATLIPSLATSWVSYLQNKRSLTAKTTEELSSLSSQAARELDLWVKARRYDLRTFASSYEVSENVERLSRARAQALARLSGYLNSVRERFDFYDEFLVLDLQGNPVASSGRTPGAVRLPPEWQAEMRADNTVLGDPAWDATAGKALMPLAVPIRVANGRLVGALVAKLNLKAVGEILRLSARGDSGEAFLITEQGRVLITSRESSEGLMRQQLAIGTIQTLMRAGAAASDYDGLRGSHVLGTARSVPTLNWSVVVEVPVSEAYRQVARLRNWTVGILAGLLIVVGGLGYLLGQLIVRPLDRLTQGAAKVAAGDLDVDLPVVSAGEIGYLTEVFNDMVRRLREGREKLELLSATDGLTGLYNRRYLMERLAAEAVRAERHNHRFSVLMADVDHFKRYNDAHGHLAGDEVLTRVATILREAIREVDTAARYGGEEFAVLLPETGLDGAADVAERIRTRVAGERFVGGTVTLSVGVAEFPAHGDGPESVTASADAALYDAKSAGRNRVERATRKRTSKQTKLQT